MEQSPLDQLGEGLNQLVGVLTVDLMNDPEIYALISQLLMILEGQPDLLSPDLVQQLSQIPDKLERFKAAAQSTQASTPDQMKDLLDSMKAVGL